MSYSQATVIAGGLAHTPVLIALFWTFEKLTNNNKTTKAPKPKEQKVSPPPIQLETALSSEENTVSSAISSPTKEDISNPDSKGPKVEPSEIIEKNANVIPIDTLKEPDK